MKRIANLVDLENFCKMSIWLQESALIQPITSPLKFLEIEGQNGSVRGKGDTRLWEGGPHCNPGSEGVARTLCLTRWVGMCLSIMGYLSGSSRFLKELFAMFQRYCRLIVNFIKRSPQRCEILKNPRNLDEMWRAKLSGEDPKYRSPSLKRRLYRRRC